MQEIYVGLGMYLGWGGQGMHTVSWWGNMKNQGDTLYPD
jgi:hypothetical protein